MSVPAAASTCPTCHAAVAPGSSFCTRCGAVLAVREIAAEVGGDTAWGGSRRRRDAAAPGGAATAVTAVAGVDTAFRALQQPGQGPTPGAAGRPDASVSALGPAFDGVAPAGAGRRVAAFAIDSAVVAVVGAGVWLLTDGPVYAALATLEVVAGLVVWEARSGRTVGNAALGLRAAQDDVPYAPGLGRSLARAAVVGAGHLVLGVGQWLVVASTAFDASGRRQGWHDKLASTVVVDVRALRREDAPVTVHAPVVTGPVAVPGVPDASVVPTPDLPPAVPGAVPPRPPQPSAHTAPDTRGLPPVPPPPAQQTPPPPPAQQTPPPPPAQQTPAPRPVPTAVPAQPAGPSVPAATAVSTGASSSPARGRATSYVVTLDDGRAMSVSGPGYVGRRPQAPAGERVDHVIEIEDPGRSLSRTHARFGIDEQGFWVEDNGSANGTAVVAADGAAHAGAPGERLRVPDGGTVRLGERTFTVHPYG